jgi:peptidoglycan/LPS O-acetylase OafA/YrhL
VWRRRPEARGVGGLLVNQSSPRVPVLDGLRGIAILLVLARHCSAMVQAEPGSILAYGVACLRLTWGTDLFFVLSGFLIGGILLDNRFSDNYFEVFYTKRICRIFPLYFVFLILFVALLPAVPATLSWFVKATPSLLWYATFTQNFAMAIDNDMGAISIAPTWSLAVEQQFYLFLPFVIRYCDPRKLPWFLIGGILTAPLLRSTLNYWHGGGDLFAVLVLTPCRMDALLLGTFCAWILRQQTLRQLLFVNWIGIVLHVPFAFLLIGAAFLTIKLGSPFSLGMSSFGYTWMALLHSCLLLIVVTQKRSLLHYITSNALLRRLGVISYGVFLFHFGIFGLVHGLILHQDPTIANVTDGLVTLLALMLTLGLAALSYEWFEKPFMTMVRTLNYRKISRSAPYSGYYSAAALVGMVKEAALRVPAWPGRERPADEPVPSPLACRLRKPFGP